MNVTHLHLTMLSLILAVLPASIMAQTVERKDISIRDPYILVDSGKFYMYCTGTFDHQRGFDVYETTDPTLQTWSKPKSVFRKTDDFWAPWAYWAPEVFPYKGKYYLFATFEGPNRPRCVQILRSDSPTGPFVVHSPEPVTDPKVFSLDGTLYIDKKGDPWLVYSREWVSAYNGEFRALRLKSDLSGILPGGEDILLFKAGDAPWAAWFNHEGKHAWLSDGPQMLRTSKGDLLIIFSSNNHIPQPIDWSYAVGVARSTSGDIKGPWVLESKPLYNGFAGHGMIFKHPKDGFMLSVHQPNYGHPAYPMFLHIYERDGKLTMADPTTPKYVQAYWRFEDGTPEHAVLPSIDILDMSGKDNHLRGADHETTGKFSADVPAKLITGTKRANLFSYDNSEPGGAKGPRYLSVTSKPINSLQMKRWTIEASICLKTPGENQTIVGKDAVSGTDGESALKLQITPDNEVLIGFWTKGGKYVSAKSSAKIIPSQWYSIAATCDGHALKLFLDARDNKGYRLESTTVLPEADNSPAAGDAAWTVGRGMTKSAPGEQFLGLIDEVRISDTGLRPDQFLFHTRD